MLLPLPQAFFYRHLFVLFLSEFTSGQLIPTTCPLFQVFQVYGNPAYVLKYFISTGMLDFMLYFMNHALLYEKGPYKLQFSKCKCAFFLLFLDVKPKFHLIS